MFDMLANNKEAMAQLRAYLEVSLGEYIIQQVKLGNDTTGYSVGYKMVDIALTRIRNDFERKEPKKFDNSSK